VAGYAPLYPFLSSFSLPFLPFYGSTKRRGKRGRGRFFSFFFFLFVGFFFFFSFFVLCAPPLLFFSFRTVFFPDLGAAAEQSEEFENGRRPDLLVVLPLSLPRAFLFPLSFFLGHGPWARGKRELLVALGLPSSAGLITFFSLEENGGRWKSLPPPFLRETFFFRRKT